MRKEDGRMNEDGRRKEERRRGEEEGRTSEEEEGGKRSEEGGSIGMKEGVVPFLFGDKKSGLRRSAAGFMRRSPRGSS